MVVSLARLAELDVQPDPLSGIQKNKWMFIKNEPSIKNN
jgi:hypothetical protein